MRDMLEEICRERGFLVEQFASGDEFLTGFQPKKFDLVLCDFHMPDKTGLDVISEALGEDSAYWVLVSGFATIEIVKKANQMRSVDFLEKPFSNAQFDALIERAQRSRNSSLEPVFLSVEVTTRVRLSSGARAGLESRITKRIRSLGLPSDQEYLKYFAENRALELEIITGILTTHTTSFFREMAHFDFLEKEVLPKLLLKNFANDSASNHSLADTCTIWSAASSTGQEVYSLAIACQKFLSDSGTKPSRQFRIVGTDVDGNSIGIAKEGLYSAEEIGQLDKSIVQKYFQQGTADLSHLYKIKNEIWNQCSFQQHNLLSKNLPLQQAEVIFLRNVLIYFSPEDVKAAVNSMVSALKVGGFLFVGHTETGLVQNSEMELLIPGVYRKRAGKSPRTDLSQSLQQNAVTHLLAIGSSTGGTQALRVALRHLQKSDFPPVLIAQHFSESHSRSFAKTLETDLNVTVLIPVDGDKLKNNCVYLCPGNHHIEVDRQLRIKITQATPEDKVSPEINRLFRSIAEHAKNLSVLSIILTGMGKDGGDGQLALLKSVKRITTVAESKETAVVYGMPQYATEIGAAQYTIDLPQIGLYVKSWISGMKKEPS